MRAFVCLFALALGAWAQKPDFSGIYEWPKSPDAAKGKG